MIRALIVLLVFPLWSNAYQKELITLPSNSDINILYVGDYMKGEIDINLMNKEWWGVFEDNKQSFIKKVEIKLEKIEPDIQYDWEYRVSVENEKKCIFLLTGLNLNDKTFYHFTTNDVIRDSELFTFEFGPYHTFISSEIESLNFIGDVPRTDYSVFLNYQTQDILTHLTTKRLLLLLNSLRSFMYRDIAVKLAVHLLLTLKDLRIWQKPLKIRPLVTIKFV